MHGYDATQILTNEINWKVFLPNLISTYQITLIDVDVSELQKPDEEI